MSEKVWGAEGKPWGVLRMPYNLAGDGSHSDAENNDIPTTP